MTTTTAGVIILGFLASYFAGTVVGGHVAPDPALNTDDDLALARAVGVLAPATR